MNKTRIILACLLLSLFFACAILLGKQIADTYAVRSINQKELAYVESLNDRILLLRGIRDMTSEIETLKKDEAALDRELDRIKDEIRTNENKIVELKKDIRRYEDPPALPDQEYLPPSEFVLPGSKGPDDENDEEIQSGTEAESEEKP